MAQGKATARGEGYPRLTADQVDMIIGMLADHAGAGTRPRGDADPDRLMNQLATFYMRRWGLPPCLAPLVSRALDR